MCEVAQNWLEHVACFKIDNKPWFLEGKYSFCKLLEAGIQRGYSHREGTCTFREKKKVDEPPLCGTLQAVYKAFVPGTLTPVQLLSPLSAVPPVLGSCAY